MEKSQRVSIQVWLTRCTFRHELDAPADRLENCQDASKKAIEGGYQAEHEHETEPELQKTAVYRERCPVRDALRVEAVRLKYLNDGDAYCHSEKHMKARREK